MTRGTRTTAPERRKGAPPVRQQHRILSTSISKGDDALSRGDWTRARDCFEHALRVEETPEALEGLGAAAWWLEDDATVFRAREQAYRLYRRRGDLRGAGRVATALAGDHLQLRGEAAQARGWHRRAHRLLDGLHRIPEQGWLSLWEGDLALTLGDEPGRVRGLAVEAGEMARALGDVDLEMTALALEGLANVLRGEPSEGLLRLDEATTAAMSGEMTSPLAIGVSCCYLVMACERIRDFARAAEWCRRVKEFCDRTGFQLLLAVCRAQHAGVLTWQGAWVEAEEELQAVLRRFGDTRPHLKQEVLLRLAELRRLQGRVDEAALLLSRIDDAHPLSLLGRAALSLDRSDPATAVDLARRALRQVGTSNRPDRIAALDVLSRAYLALGQRGDARASLDELQAIAAAVGTEPVKATVLFDGGLAAAAEGDHARAREAFEDAMALLARSSASFELARCRVELGRALASLGRRDAAEAELREASRAFEALGADRHVATTSALRRELASGAHRPARGGTGGGLTRREVEVLRLVAQGLSNHEIARHLTVSEFTVKRHVANVLAKLALRSRAAAAAHAARAGLV